MSRLTKAMMVAGVLGATVWAGDWTNVLEVRHDTTLCVTYRARWTGQYLVVQVTPETGWHTFAVDNKQRAEEKLAGKKSLGIDQPTDIKLSDGLEVAGPWFESPPKDFSKPELRWYSWGYEEQATFVAKARHSGAGPARIAIRGQACSSDTCKNIDVAISVPLGGAGSNAGPDFKTLVQVR